MVTHAEVDVLQSLANQRTTLVKSQGNNGQVVVVLVSFLWLYQFLFASLTQRLDGFVACHYLEYIARIDAMTASGNVYPVSCTYDGHDVYAVGLAEVKLSK